jgi:teichoic acid transport system ATP-binding protein
VSDDLAVVADAVEITYRVYSDRRPSMRQRVALGSKSRAFESVEAVRGVTLHVRSGEAVGIVGSNGSGKSSLVRAIAGLLPVDGGRIMVRGEPTLLGVGAALNNQLSGARNILLGCMALGMTRAQAEASFDDVVDFAGVRHAINRPLRTYSSGMKSRLQFAIATSVDPDILLIDEALSTGDQAFKRKSERRIRRLRKRAKVVILVSHNLRQVRKACTRAAWMNEGRLMLDGDPKTVVRAYRAHIRAERKRLKKSEQAED